MGQPKGCTPWNKGKKGIQVAWNKGIPRTPEEKEAIRNGITPEGRKIISETKKEQWKQGKYDSMFGDTNPACRPEVKEKIGDASRNRIVSDVTRKRISDSRIGKPGAVWTEEMRENASIRMKENNPMKDENIKNKSHESFRKTVDNPNFVHPNKGRARPDLLGKPSKMSQEAKDIAAIRMRENNPMFRDDVIAKHPILKSGCFYFSEGEKRIWKALESLGLIFKIDFDPQYKVRRIGKRSYFLDFYLLKLNTVIEFDRDIHHILNPEKDIERDKYILEILKAKTFRFLPRDTNNSEELKNRIREIMNNAD